MNANPQVEVVWSKLEEQSQVCIRGKVAAVEDEAMQQRFREDNLIVVNLLPEAAQYLFCLYELQLENVYLAKGMVPYTEVAW